MTRLVGRTKWVLGLTTIAALAVALWIFVSPNRGSPRLFVGEPSVTNAFAYFTLTNQHRYPVEFYFTAEQKTDAAWPLSFAPAGTPLGDVSPATIVAPGQISTVRVLIPFEKVPWRLRVLYREVETRRDRFLRNYGGAMDDIGLGGLAEKIADSEPWYEIYGRETRR